MSRVNFVSDREREVFLEGLRLAIESYGRSPHEPVLVRCEDPRIGALFECLKKAEHWLSRADGHQDSDMVKHFLELLGIQAFLIAESICGNTKFHEKAA